MSGKKFSRRIFLKGSGVAGTTAFALSPVEILLSSLLQGLCDTAYAEETNASSITNYIHLSVGGGLPRWMFDLPLLAGEEIEKTFLNKMLITKITNVSDEEAHYAMTKYYGEQFPHFWNAKVATSDGGSRNVSELLKHILTFRGLNLQADGHSLNLEKRMTPVPGGYSLSGLAADRADFPFPSVYSNRSFNYRAPSGVGAIGANGGNPIAELLEAFKGRVGSRNFETGKTRFFGGNDTEVENLIQMTLNKMEQIAENSPNKTKKLFSDTRNAKRIFLREFGNLSEIYNDLNDKYENLIKRSLRMNNLSGVDSMPVIAGEIPEGIIDGSMNVSLDRFDVSGLGRIKPGTDLRDTLVFEGQTLGSRGETITNNDTTISQLAKNMALAEFVITRKLSSSIAIEGRSLINVTAEVLSDRQNPNATKRERNRFINNDAHPTGAIPTLFYFSKYYKGLTSCLLEFFNVLEATPSGSSKGSMFNTSVLNFASEFNRSARPNGNGSDHGWRGSNATLFSGMIKAPIVIGNIQEEKDSRNGWGIAAPLDELGGREMVIGNVASSISSILGCESPTPNDQSLVKIENHQVKSLTGRSKNV